MGHMGFLYMQGIGKQCETTWPRKLVAPLSISYIYTWLYKFRYIILSESSYFGYRCEPLHPEVFTHDTG